MRCGRFPLLRRLRRFAVGGGQACDAGGFLRRCLFGGGRAGDAGGFDLFSAFLRFFLRLTAGGRFFICFYLLRRLRWRFGSAFCVWGGRVLFGSFFRCLRLKRAGAFLRCLRLVAGGRFLGVFGWRLACVRCGWFLGVFAFFALGGRLFLFCDVCIGISGELLAHFAVLAFGGERPFFFEALAVGGGRDAMRAVFIFAAFAVGGGRERDAGGFYFLRRLRCCLRLEAVVFYFCGVCGWRRAGVFFFK